MSAGRLQEFKLHVVTLQRSLAILLESYRSRQPDDGRGDPSAPAIRDDPGAKGFLSDNSS